MARGKLNELLNQLNDQIEKSQKFAEKNKKTSDEVTKASSASWSAGGDILYAQGQATITKENLEALKAFKAKVEKEIKEPVSETVIPTCFVTVKYDNLDKPSSFYFVESPVYVSGFKFVTVDSNLGKIINGRKKGDKLLTKTTNEFGEVDTSLEILEIE